MTAFQVTYSVNGQNGDKVFEATDLIDAYTEMMKILHDEVSSTEQPELAVVKVKNLETEEEYIPNTEESILVPA